MNIHPDKLSEFFFSLIFNYLYRSSAMATPKTAIPVAKILHLQKWSGCLSLPGQSGFLSCLFAESIMKLKRAIW